MTWFDKSLGAERKDFDTNVEYDSTYEREKEQRHTTVHDRYEISDPICGRIEGATSLAKALKIAAAHPCQNVEVFDVNGTNGLRSNLECKGRNPFFPETLTLPGNFATLRMTIWRMHTWLEN
jgi:hypothetical protein